jgi:DNA-binding LytR/AlgR family response regulator
LLLDEERIKYIVCEGHYCNIYIIDKSEYRVRYSLKFFEKDLELEDDGFFRCSHNTLINVRYVDHTQSSHTKRTLYIVVNKEKEPLPISKRNVHLFKEMVLKLRNNSLTSEKGTQI